VVLGDQMIEPDIFHGTPFTPREAMIEVLTGRAICVSWWRPDDLEVALAIARAIMFRQRRLLRMAGSARSRRRVVRPGGLDALLSLARADAFRGEAVRDHSRCARCAVADQRRANPAVAVRTGAWSSPLAHEHADLPPGQAVRAVPAGRTRVDWGVRPSHQAHPQGGAARRLRCLSSTHGRGCRLLREQVAGYAHDARGSGGARLPIPFGRLGQRREERPSPRPFGSPSVVDGRIAREVVREAPICRSA
jgi:hypothetical protein